MEMLYDLEKDPGQLSNLATDPEHAETLSQMRSRMEGYLTP